MPITVFETIRTTRAWVDVCRTGGLTISFVPTMGALHAGHISLIKQAKQGSDVVISSIFVNPTQFNNPADLLKYPRTLGADIAMLEEAGCNAVFAPDVAEMYPTMQKGHWDFGLLSSRLEGHFRPGHFDGVCTVVKKLLEVTSPHMAFFGEKDFQQLAIIRQLVKYERMEVEVIGCPTMREADGLAMSSRNLRLSPEQRQQALAISRTLFAMRSHKENFDPLQLENFGKEMLADVSGLQTEYLQIVDGDSFEDITHWKVNRPVVLYAGYCGEVRLIDNVLL